MSIERAKVAGMRELLAVPADHTLMMNSPEFIMKVCRFLAVGSFDRPQE